MLLKRGFGRNEIIFEIRWFNPYIHPSLSKSFLTPRVLEEKRSIRTEKRDRDSPSFETLLFP
jgi:hypothetical protein